MELLWLPHSLIKPQVPENENNHQLLISLQRKKSIKIENLSVIDNTHKHRGHKFFSSKKFHIKLEIRSSYLKSLSKVNAQRLIMNILKEDLAKTYQS